MRFTHTLAGLGAAFCAAGAGAEWQTIDLGHFVHGQVVNGEWVGPATADATSFHHDESHLVVFDTHQRGTRDADLEGPDGQAGAWSGGNLNRNESIGPALIIQQVDRGFAGFTDADHTRVLEPDDEERNRDGTNPGAGEIAFTFDQPAYAFQFTLVDVERTQAFEDRTGSFVVYEGDGQRVKIAFIEFTDPESLFYDPGIAFGDHTANRVPAVTAGQLGLTSIERVTINLGGSGAVGGLSYLDEPALTIESAFAMQDPAIEGGGGGTSLVLFAEPSNEPDPYGPPGGSPAPTPDPKGVPENTPTGVPTPGAGLAGLTILGLMLVRRNRPRI